MSLRRLLVLPKVYQFLRLVIRNLNGKNVGFRQHRQPRPTDKRHIRFKNLCVLDYEHPYAITNILLADEKETGSMLKLTTLQMSMLVPRIRLFKTVYDLNLEEEFNIELPFEDVASSEDIERIYTNSTGRGSGCGIESFEWKSLGKNQGNIAQFSATLKLFFKNIEELLQVRNTAKLSNGRVIRVTPLDLIIQKPDLRNTTNEGSGVFDPKYFGIKVEVGWHLKSEPNIVDLFKSESTKHGDDPEKILDVILKQKHFFYLTLQSHSLEINDDGTVNLSTDYVASAEMEASHPVSANILRLSKTHEQQLQIAIENHKSVTRRMNSLQLSSVKSEEGLAATQTAKNYRHFAGDNFDSSYEKTTLSDEDSIAASEYQRLKTEKEETSKTLNELKKRPRTDRLKTIIESLYEDGLINTLCITNEDIQALTSLKGIVIETRDQLESVRTTLDTIKLNTKIVPQNSLNLGALDALTQNDESGGTDTSPKVNFKASTLTDDKKKTCPDKSKQIAFFFLGDLLNVVLENIFSKDSTKVNNFIEKTTRVLLGPITYYDFGSIEDHGLIIRTKGTTDENGKLVSLYTGKQTIVNIADIPISIQDFTTWFVDNVINSPKESYNFLSFARDLIDGLIIKALASETYKFAPRQQVRVNLLPFSAPKNDNNEEIYEEVLQQQNINIARSFRFDLSETFGLNKKPLKPFIRGSSSDEKQNYILFYGINQPPFERVAEQKKDMEQKIFHLFIGEERGIVRNVKFSRDDNPYARASNIQQHSPEKQGDGMIVREKYGCNLSCFGNFLFIPGQQIFVHPSYPGLKGKNVRENIFRSIGLGGYYRVIEINSTLSSGEFETNVVAKWEAFGDGTLNIGDKIVGERIVKDQSLVNEPENVQLVLPE